MQMKNFTKNNTLVNNYTFSFNINTFSFNININKLINFFFYTSIFAKAHEYKCGYVDRNGIQCDGAPKLGEFTQVCITHFLHFQFFIFNDITIILQLIFYIGSWFSNVKKEVYRLH